MRKNREARQERKAERVERRTTKRATRVVRKAARKLGKIDRKRERFSLDPITGRPTEGDEPQAVTDPAGNTFNIFAMSPQDGGAYPTGSMQPLAPKVTSVTDRSRLDLACQIGDL